jgi:hypothetical protein
MTYVLAFLAAIAGAAAGALLGGIIGGALAPVFGISSFEGASGYFVVLVCAPIGGLIGLVVGAVWVLRQRGVRSAGALAGRFSVVVLGLIALAAGVFATFYFSQDILNPNGPSPRLAFEIRLPPGVAPPTGRDRGIELQTSKNRMPPNTLTVSQDGDRAVIAGTVDLYFRTTQRMLVMAMPDKRHVLFNLKLGAKPSHSKQFGAWQRADFIGEPGDDHARRPTPDESYDIRYRAVWQEQE